MTVSYLETLSIYTVKEHDHLIFSIKINVLEIFFSF